MPLLNSKRRALLSQGKFFRYFTYALGEVIIITAGVLVAVQVNDWNERKKQAREIDLRLASLEREMRENQHVSMEMIQWACVADSSCMRLLMDSVKEEEVGVANGPVTLVARLYPLSYQTNQLDELLSAGNEWPEHRLEIQRECRRYQMRTTLTTDLMEPWESIVFDNVRHYGDTYTWFGRRDPKSIRRAAHFMVTDSLYRNRVIQYRMVMAGNVAHQASMTSLQAEQALLQIAEVVHPAGAFDEAQYLREAGWEELRPCAADSAFMPNIYASFTVPSMAVNRSSDSVRVWMEGRDAVPFADRTLAPGETKGILGVPRQKMLIAKAGDSTRAFVHQPFGLVVIGDGAGEKR